MNVLMQRNDPGRAGVNGGEKSLNPANVNVNTFGKLHAVPLNQGGIYAQPLYVAQLDFGPPRGKRDTVFVATMGNWVFAIDANSGAVLEQKLVDSKPPVPSWTYFTRGYQDVVAINGNEPTIGILSTPVIDAAAKEIYLVLFTVDDRAKVAQATDAERVNAFQYRLYVLDLLTLEPKRSVAIGGSVAGTGYHASQRVGNGDGMIPRDDINLNAAGELTVQAEFAQKPGQTTIGVLDATGIGSHDPRVHFNAMMQLQRPGLLLDRGIVYLAFGSRGDDNPYHGWVFAYRAADLTLIDLLCTTANGAQGGIWQAGQGLIIDAQGNIYCGTGNGDSRQAAGGQPGTPNMGESFIKLRLGNGRLEVVGWYNAFDDLKYQPVTGDPNGPDPRVEADVKQKDDDLGASAPALLPDGRIVGGGKDGYFYLVDADQLIGDAAARQEQPKADRVVLQAFLAAYNFDRGTRRVPRFLDPTLSQAQATHHIHGSPVVWQADPHGCFVYVWGENDAARAFQYVLRQPGQPLSGGFPGQGAIAVAPLLTSDDKRIPLGGIEDARGMLVASNEVFNRNGMPGGFLSLSWDGQNTNSAILWACYPPFENGNRQPVEGELVAYDASAFDPQFNFVRMNAIWRSRQNVDDHFGRLPKFCCPSVADGRVFVPAGDGSALFIYGLKAQAQGGYDLTRDAHTSGFGGKDGLTLNGSAAIGAALASGRRPVILTQTQGVRPQVPTPTFFAGSVFGTAPVDVTDLRTSFTVQLRPPLDARGVPNPNNMADGFTFTVQDVGPRALGSPGSGLGYAQDPFDVTGTGARIPRSLALAFSVVTNTVALWRDGAAGAPPFHDLGNNQIALNSGHPIRVAVAFSAANRTLALTVTDTTAPQNTTGPLVLNNVDLVGFLKLGAPPRAFIGFTGGTGVKSAEQAILDWSVP